MFYRPVIDTPAAALVAQRSHCWCALHAHIQHNNCYLATKTESEEQGIAINFYPASQERPYYIC